MTAAVRDNGTKEAAEWAAGEDRNAKARAHVAAQLTELLLESNVGSGPSTIAIRVRQYVQAERSGDRESTRAAVMELAVAAAAGAASLDLKSGSR